MFELTLAARERVLGADHPKTLNSRGSLAAAYRDAGRVAEALQLFELTLEAREQVLGVNHPDTLTSRDNLAAAYREAGRVAEAIPLVEQTLAARERLLGADHHKTLASRNNLATAYRDSGRPAEAIPLYERNLAACERLLGANHLKTLSTRKSLASAYREAGQPEKAGSGDTSSPLRELVNQVEGDFQDDGPQLVGVVHLLQVEHAGRADRLPGFDARRVGQSSRGCSGIRSRGTKTADGESTEQAVAASSYRAVQLGL